MRRESLDSRLAEERRDKPLLDEGLGLIDEDAPDDESQMVAESVPDRDAFEAPEETAMSVRDEPSGPDRPSR